MVIPKKILYAVFAATLFALPATRDAMFALSLLVPCAIVFIYLAAHLGKTASLLATILSTVVTMTGVFSCLNF